MIRGCAISDRRLSSTSRATVAGVNWSFNGWGKYPHENDQHVARFVLERLGLPRIEAPLVLEGGSIHVDGEGTVLTTEQCLLHPNRNPELDKQQIEQLVLEYLGAQQVVWLPQGIADDDTDGHIDEIACFVAPGVVLALVANDKRDIDFAPLQRNADILRETRDARGRKLDVLTLEQPETVYRGEQRLSQSYVNFYIANGGIVMPAFGDRRRDEQARGVIAELFPRRKVVQIPARELAYGGGNIHCITQQQPAVKGGEEMSKVIVAATQMACDWDRDGNIARAEKLVRARQIRARKLFCCRNYSRRRISASIKARSILRWRQRSAENPAVNHFRVDCARIARGVADQFFRACE